MKTSWGQLFLRKTSSHNKYSFSTYYVQEAILHTISYKDYSWDGRNQRINTKFWLHKYILDDGNGKTDQSMCSGQCVEVTICCSKTIKVTFEQRSKVRKGQSYVDNWGEQTEQTISVLLTPFCAYKHRPWHQGPQITPTGQHNFLV